MAQIRKTHTDQIERWAHFVKNNPDKWKSIHSEFINAIFEKHNQFIEKISKTKEGKEKLDELYGTKIIGCKNVALKLCDSKVTNEVN